MPPPDDKEITKDITEIRVVVGRIEEQMISMRRDFSSFADRQRECDAGQDRRLLEHMAECRMNMNAHDLRLKNNEAWITKATVLAGTIGAAAGLVFPQLLRLVIHIPIP